MTGREQDDATGGIREYVVGPLYLIARDLLAIWFDRPLAFGIATLIVFPMLFPFPGRKTTLVKWLSAAILLAVLLPAVQYVIPYYLCGYEWGAMFYGLIVGASIFVVRLIWIGLLGGHVSLYKFWLVVASCLGLLMGICFLFLPTYFCGSFEGIGLR